MLLQTIIRNILLSGCLLAVLSTARLTIGQEATDGAIVAPAAPQGPPSTKKEKTEASHDTEGAVQKALENNPDIAVAKAKVQEAEAELKRTQWRVARDVLALQSATTTAEFTYKHALEANEKHAKAVSAIEVKRLWSEWVGRKTELQYMLGSSGSNAPAANTFIADRVERSGKVLPTPGPLEAIRKVLEQPTEMEFADMPLGDVVTYLKDRHGTEIQLDRVALEDESVGPDTKIAFNLKNKPLGAALEAFEDLYPYLRFVMRDYGIVITLNGSPLDKKAASAVEYWRSQQPGAKKEETTSGGTDSGKGFF